MLNNVKFKIMTPLVVSGVFFTFIAGKCSGDTLVLPKDEYKAAEQLEGKGYRINENRLKPGKHIKYVEINQNTKYEKGDLEAICNIPTLEGIKFEKITFPDLTEEEIESCSKQKIKHFIFTEIKDEKDSLCRILKSLNYSDLSISFYYSKISKDSIFCVFEVALITNLGIDGDLNITDDDFCFFSKKLKNLRFLRLNYSNLGKKSLECILNFPSLSSVMLQNWKNVPMEEHFKIMEDYERKYGRQVEKLITDTY